MTKKKTSSSRLPPRLKPPAPKPPAPQSSPLSPSVQLLCKLGSIIVHVDEMLSPGGHPADKTAIESGLKDPELRAWIAEMTDSGYLPVQRNVPVRSPKS